MTMTSERRLEWQRRLAKDGHSSFAIAAVLQEVLDWLPVTDEGEGRTAICKSCGQTVSMAVKHDCPGIGAAPVEGDEAWREAVNALRKLGLPPEIVSEDRALAAVKAIVAKAPRA